MADKKHILTYAGLKQYEDELQTLKVVKRKEVAQKIKEAREQGDLSENGGYQAAREAQSKNEGRITELTVKLRDSKIIENAPEGTVGEGSVVTIELNGNEMTYVLGSRDIVAGTDYDIMTPDSPIGKAIEGAKVGDVVSYTAPNGRELSVTVKAAKPLA